jgi:hypothetical protein
LRTMHYRSCRTDRIGFQLRAPGFKVEVQWMLVAIIYLMR